MADADLDLNVSSTPLSSARQVRSTLRKPRAKVTANGTTLRWLMVEVVNTANHQSDAFMVRLPLFDPKAAHDWVWWASQATVEIEISVGFADQGGASTTLTRLIWAKSSASTWCRCRTDSARLAAAKVVTAPFSN